MTSKTTSEKDYVIEVAQGMAEVPADAWDALLETQALPTPFMRHACLQALEASGSATPRTGWRSLPVLLRAPDGSLAGAAPCYLKSHSYGEYVFDWAWADAYRRHGLVYYPKLVIAVPFMPVPGSRLLARDADARALLLRGVAQLTRQIEASSAHLLFGDAADLDAAEREGWMLRQGVQFHWHNRHSHQCTEPQPPYADFAEFLASLQRDKRKKIQQERRRVAEAGIEFEIRQGEQIEPADWDFFYRCHTATYEVRGSMPYLSREFFDRMAERMPEHWVLFIAHRAGQPDRRIACSLIAVDRERGTAWGRYWGALEPVSCLHFEACYYQPLQWCIEQRLRSFEGGAQGEHKMARGLLPVRTASAHWVADRRFAQAIGEHLQQEAGAIDDYLDELDDRTPFKRAE